MHIDYLSGSTFPSETANSVQVMEMCNAFAAVGHRVCLFGVGSSDNTWDLSDHYGVDAPIELFLDRPRSSRGGGYRFAHWVRKTVRAHDLPDLFYGRHVYSLAAVADLGVPVVFESHQFPSGAVKRMAQRWLLGRAALANVVVISEALREAYVGWRPEVRSRTVVAHDAARHLGSAPQVVSWPGRKGRLQVGYVGSLFPGKGLEIVVPLAARMPDVDVHVIGPSRSERMESRSSNLYIHGYIPHARLGGYYSKLDVGLLPLQDRVSHAGGGSNIAKWTSPLKLFEYMHHGVPVIASDLPVLREVLHDNETAILVPCDDLNAWVEAVRRLESTRTLRLQLADHARSVASSRHTWIARASTVLEGVSAGGFSND